MHTLYLVSTAIVLMILPMFEVQSQAATRTPNELIVIDSPQPGQVLQGTVLIRGETFFENPTDIILSFSYHDDTRDTWFFLQALQDINQQELTFEWDTTTLTDGDYTIKLSAASGPGEQAVLIPGLRVRNYTAVETNTPRPTSTPAPLDTRSPTITPTKTITPIPPTATELPPNPARVSSDDIRNSIIIGVSITLGVFLVLGILQFIRNRRKKKV